MATTISTLPDDFSGCLKRPIRFVCTSDIYDVSTNAEAVSAVSDSGGFCRYAIATHDFKVGDVLTGSGFDPATTYNVRQTVTVTNAAYVETNVAFDVNDTGTLTRTNDNFQMKGQLTVNSTVIGTIYVNPDSLGNFNFDFQKLIRSTFDAIDVASLTATGITTNNTNMIKTFQVDFTGLHDDRDGLQVADNDGAETSTLKRAIDFRYKYDEDKNTDAYVLKTGQLSKFLTNIPLTGIDLREDEPFHLAFITDVAQIKYVYQTWNGTAWSVSTVSSGITVTGKHGILSIYNLFSGNDKIRVWIIDNAVSFASEQVIFNRQTTQTNERFYFRNKRGGYDFINLTGELSKLKQSDKVSFKKGLTHDFSIGDRGEVTTGEQNNEERTAYMNYKDNDTTEWASELIDSEDVYIMSGTNRIPVRILTDEIEFYNNLKFSKISVRYRILNN